LYRMKIVNLVYITVIFFFFSSRRRHTRSKRDWSSDVCSSDLINRREFRNENCNQGHRISPKRHTEAWHKYATVCRTCGHYTALRSEERRVGKECRSRKARDDYKEEREEEEHRIVWT